MKRRIPIWLLRDIPAFVAVMATFWPLMILVILNGWKVMSGKQVSRRVYDRIGVLLAKAESRLDHALWRQAHRACGYHPRSATFLPIPPPASWSETGPRFEAYRNAFQNMDMVAHVYADELRRRYGVRSPWFDGRASRCSP